MRRGLWLAGCLASGSAWGQENTQVLFTMGQIEVFARQPDTDVVITNLATGAPHTAFTLANEGSRYSATTGVPNYVSVTSDKPVTLFTGKALAGSNDWSSVINSDNNTEFGRKHHGFTEHFVWVVMPRTPGDISQSSVQIVDVSDGDDSVTLTRSSATLDTGTLEIYERSGFENDTLIVTCSRDCMVQVGSSSIKTSTGWALTPPSLVAGEDGRELGTRFAFFANPDLTIWPFTDGTVVDIIDWSDGDDSRIVQMDADEFFSTRNLTGITGRRSLVHASGALFDADFVEVRSNHPVLAYVGPSYDPGGGFTLDFAPTVPTGQGVQEGFVYANSLGVDLLTFDRTATVTLRTVSGSGNHSLTVTPSDWLGAGPYYFRPATDWNRELVHVVSDKPIAAFYGDYQTSYFPGCCSASFVPVLPRDATLKPVAEAGVSVIACPYDTIAFDGSASFDADDLGPEPALTGYAWDFDLDVNSDGRGGRGDDVDSDEVTGTYRYTASGLYQIQLTVTDNEGQTDTDIVVVTIDVGNVALCGADDDGDDVGAGNDNCPGAHNPGQEDFDEDGDGDACDDDDDDDGIDDDVDNCPLEANPGQEASDDDGDGDACDDDDDDDGVLDDADNCPTTANPHQGDLDRDDLGDACDDDRDGDDVDDDLDVCPGVFDPEQHNSDADPDGDACDDDDDGDDTVDAEDNCPLLANDQSDHDEDGLGDACDPDDDNDLVADVIDNCRFVPNGNQRDQDDDGAGDACDPDRDGDDVENDLDNCPYVANDQTNSDTDGLGDACDDDDDGDGVPDEADLCPGVGETHPVDTDHDGQGDACDDDDDGDRVPDDVDLCPLVFDPFQENADEDALGDACDPDTDGDGVDDALDLCPRIFDDQADLDDDEIGDACDDDRDGDGVIDLADRCPDVSDPTQADADADGEGDACDDDDDGDGVPDDDDVCPLVHDDQADLDDDGVGDACEGDTDGDGVGDDEDLCPLVADDQADLDDDGIGDACDPDADGDAVLDYADNCLGVDNYLQLDEDDDGIGDACDPDPECGCATGPLGATPWVGVLLLLVRRRRVATPEP